jgi:hypothetical protein
MALLMLPAAVQGGMLLGDAGLGIRELVRLTVEAEWNASISAVEFAEVCGTLASTVVRPLQCRRCSG